MWWSRHHRHPNSLALTLTLTLTPTICMPPPQIIFTPPPFPPPLKYYNRHMAFIPAFSESQSDWPRDPFSAKQGATRARREFPLGETPQSRRTIQQVVVTNMSSCSLTEWMQIQLLAEFRATRFSNSTNLPHNISVRQQGKEATHNTTTATTRHPLPGRRQNTSHVPHDTPTHQPSHPLTMLQQYSSERMRCFALELRQSSSIRQYVPAWYVHKQTETIGPYFIFFHLETQSWLRTSHLQRSTITTTTCQPHPLSPTNRPTTHPRTGTGTYCCMLKTHVPANTMPTTKRRHPNADACYDRGIPFLGEIISE